MAGEERDFSQLSDDEVMNLSNEDFERMAATQAQQEESQEETEEQKAAREAAEAAAATGAEEEGEEQEEQDEEEVPEETEEDRLQREEDERREEEGLDEEELAELRADRAKAAKPVEKPAKKDEPVQKKPSDDGFDPDDAKRLFHEFKANGRKMAIRNADEGIRLMQLGAGYNAKMEELKPKLAVLRTLEREGLLDNDKLAFLIDLHKKNPEAIGKLVKDSGVDVLDLDADKVAAYKAGNYTTSEKEVELDAVLDELKETSSYAKLMDVVGKKWDAASKSEVGNNPGVLRVISNHMEAGYYDLILDEFERRKALGEIPSGTPFLAAYAKIGDDLNSAGKFGTPEPKPASKLVTPGKDKARATREADEQRRRAAAPTRKSGAPTPRKPVQDVWNMSDADFAKLPQPR